MSDKSSPAAVASLMKTTGEKKSTLKITDSTVKMRARQENSGSGGGCAEAHGVIGDNVDFEINKANVDFGAGRPEDDEARANMIQLFKSKILTTLPHAETCDLVDELKRLGVHAEDDLKDLSGKDIEDLKTLAPLQKRKLTNYIKKVRE